MSYTEVFAVQQNGDVVSIGEAHNGNGFAPVLWKYLYERYRLATPGAFFHMMDEPGLERMWGACGTGRFERREDVLLAATFDGAWLDRELAAELVEALRWFYETICQPRGIVRTTLAIADLIETALKDETIRGVAFNMTSVVSPFWYYHVCHNHDEDDCEQRPYNLDRDGLHPIGEYQGKRPLSARDEIGPKHDPAA